MHTLKQNRGEHTESETGKAISIQGDKPGMTVSSW